MKSVLRIVAIVFILAGAGVLFPELVVYKNVQTLVKVVLVLIGLSFLACMVILLIGLLFANSDSIIPLIGLIIIGFMFNYLNLYYTTKIVYGFEIHGILTYIILGSLVMAVCGSNKRYKKA